MRNKKIIIPVAIVLILCLFGGGLFYFKSKKVTTQKAKPTEKQIVAENVKAFLLRDSSWGQDYASIVKKEDGNIIDSGKDYIVVEYEDVFGRKHLPTYLFKDNLLVGIAYERSLKEEEKKLLALDHQTIAAQIHLVYEQLYKEEFKWNDSQVKIYDNNLWNNSILTGELTMESIWNGKDENIYLYTTSTPNFEFLLRTDKDVTVGHQYFVLVSNDYLKKNKVEDLQAIKPNNK